jgi:hypothetical protein
MSLNFEFKETYQSNLQKFNFSFIYMTAYISIFIYIYNLIYWFGFILENLSEEGSLFLFYPKFFFISILFFIFEIFNMYIADFYRKKDPFYLSKQFALFLFINISLCVPLTFLVIPSPFNIVISLMHLLNFIILISMFPVHNKKDKKNNYIIDNQFDNFNSVGFIKCKKCFSKIKYELTICPICGDKKIF